MKILTEIHDKWVRENAKKYDRGSEQKSLKNLFQHLPTELIGINELSKDLMFLAPFLQDLGLDVGKMDLVPYGSFNPSEEICMAYQRCVYHYKTENKIKTEEDLAKHISNCVNGGYEPLQEESEINAKRHDYMNEHISDLTASVASKSKILEDSTSASSNK